MTLVSDLTTSVSVIVATYRREEVLCRTLQVLSQQAYKNFEIIVVDQTPQHLPATEDYIRSLSSSGFIRYFRIFRPSLPEARNFGVLRARGDIVLFVDDDVKPHPQLISAHVKEYLNPTIGGVAGRRTHLESADIIEQMTPVGGLRRNSDTITNFSSIIRHESVHWASGCNMSFRRHLITETKFFEPRFIGSAAYEEVDFCFRLRCRGYKIVFAPDAHLIHLRAQSGGCENRRPDKRFYYVFIHNSLLFALRNMAHRDWPIVFRDRFMMGLAVSKQLQDPSALLLFPMAFARALISYRSSNDCP